MKLLLFLSLSVNAFEIKQIRIEQKGGYKKSIFEVKSHYLDNNNIPIFVYSASNLNENDPV